MSRKETIENKLSVLNPHFLKIIDESTLHAGHAGNPSGTEESHFAIEIAPGLDFYKTGPYRMYLRRKNDRTITTGAEYHSMVDYDLDYRSSPDGYKEINKWLNERSQIIYTGKSIKDPHEIGLSLFTIDKKEGRSVFFMINKFLEFSKDYL